MIHRSNSTLKTIEEAKYDKSKEGNSEEEEEREEVATFKSVDRSDSGRKKRNGS